MISVLFIIPSFKMGGAERVSIYLANGLRDHPRIVPSLFVINGEGPLNKEVAEGIPVTVAASRDKKRSVVDIKNYLNREQVDLIYAVTDSVNLLAIAALKWSRSKTRLIGSCHSTYSKMYFPSNLYRRSFTAALKVAYRFADGIVAISEDVKRDYQAQFPELSQKIVRLYNLAYQDDIFGKAARPVPAVQLPVPVYRLFSCGRLVRAKGYENLIRVVKVVVDRYDKNIGLEIAGEGPLHDHLQQLIEELELTDHVKLIGLQQNPYKYMRGCDLYVHSSLWDGLPTTIIEAMACGACVVSTDCDSGPREIIEQDVNGVLSGPPGDIEALATAIDRLLSDHHLRYRLGREAVRRAGAFGPEVIPEAYVNYFLRVMDKSTTTAIS